MMGGAPQAHKFKGTKVILIMFSSAPIQDWFLQSEEPTSKVEVLQSEDGACIFECLFSVHLFF